MGEPGGRIIALHFLHSKPGLREKTLGGSFLMFAELHLTQRSASGSASSSSSTSGGGCLAGFFLGGGDSWICPLPLASALAAGFFLGLGAAGCSAVGADFSLFVGAEAGMGASAGAGTVT